MFWAFILKIKYLPKESSNQKRSTIYAAGRCNTALFRVSSLSRQRNWQQERPWESPGLGVCAGVEACGLHGGPRGLGTKDRCGFSSPEPRENVLWSAASQPCEIKISKCHVLRGLGGCYCSKTGRTTWPLGHVGPERRAWLCGQKHAF